MSVSRRAFLRGDFRASANAIRPPWALGEDAFEARCDRCGDCVAACPTRIITAAAGELPRVSFDAGECSFCARCVSACKPGALRHTDAQLPWTLAIRIAAGCLAAGGVECRVCGELCGSGAIRFRPRRGGVARPETDPLRCTGCGACIAPCPVGAIEMEQFQ